MCSIAGYSGLADSSRERTFFDLLRHRGPDGENSVRVDDWVLLHQRLAIIDLSPAAAQPMERHGNWLVFNGEIYNYRELRAAHLPGVPLKSTADTEVLLHLLDRYGLGILRQLNGMFSFAWYNARERVLHLVRDRYGVKPLYWMRHCGGFAFASEIKPLLRLRGRVEWNDDFLQNYLHRYLTDYGAPTFDRHIEQVPAGHRVQIDHKTASTHRWYEFADSTLPATPRSFAAAAEQFEELLVDAIRLRLRADVPVAITLSGGLDSTTIYTLAKARLQANIQPFTLVRPGFLKEESDLASQLARRFGDTVIEVPGPAAVSWENALAALWMLEFPGISVSSAAYLGVYRAIQATGCRVVLEGHGGDELLGGYPVHVQAAWRTLLARGHRRAAYGLFRQQERLSHADFRPRQHRTPLLLRFLRDARRQRVGREHFESVLRETFDLTSLPLILREFDRLPMACSLESRSPFMDYRVVEFARSLPLDYKINPTGTKAILRHILRKHGVNEIAAVPWKIPFTANLLEFMGAHSVQLRAAITCLNGSLIPWREYGLRLLDKKALTWQDCHALWRTAAVPLTQQMYADWLNSADAPLPPCL